MVATAEERLQKFITAGKMHGIGEKRNSIFQPFCKALYEVERMLTERVDWSEIKSSVTYIESDSLAVIRTERNVLSWLPVFLNEQSGESFIRKEDQWIPVNEVRNFERYQKVGRKNLFDTATLETLE